MSSSLCIKKYFEESEHCIEKYYTFVFVNRNFIE
jgi:hypothetical protein